MVFKQKIIIGSLFSALISVIGVVAIFFPSVFNLEKPKVPVLKIVLSDNKSHKSMYNFLFSNQNKIVNLNIEYTEIYRAYFLPSQVAELNVSNYVKFVENNLLKEVPCYKYMKYDYGFAQVNNDCCVISNFESSPSQNNFSRECGSIGVYIRDESGKTNGIACIIILSEQSQGNILYQWKNISAPQENKMHISGFFFVNKFIDESCFSMPMIMFMPYSWYKKFWERKSEKEIIIILTPVNRKELSIGKL